MGRPGRRTDRLLILAHELDLLLCDSFPQPEDVPRSINVVPTANHNQTVEQALSRTRTVRYERKSHIIKRAPSAPSKLKEVRKEATATLEVLVKEGCLAEVAQKLIDTGADVNFTRLKSKSLIKRIRSKDQSDVRSETLRYAVQEENVQLVGVLVRHADPTNRNEVLEGAIATRNVEIVKMLMNQGADPNICAAEFKAATRIGNTELACALSSGSLPPSQELVSSVLYDAVTTNQLRLVQVLIWRKADADMRNPSALILAAQRRQGGLIAALCLADPPPSAAHLSEAIAAVTGTSTRTLSADDMRSLEILLAAGAEGTEVLDLIQEATLQKHYQLVKLLVEYSAFDPERSPISIKSAMDLGDLTLFKALHTEPVAQRISDDLLTHLWKTRGHVSLEVRLDILRSILVNQPSKAAVGAALLDATYHQEPDGAKFLVNHGASVDYQSGSALVSAVRYQSIELVTILLGARPSTNTLSRAFASIDDIPMAAKLRIAKLLLDAGATGNEVDKALRLSVADDSQPRQNYEFILSLVVGGADVNVDSGCCLTSAIDQEDVRLLKLLLLGKPSSEVLHSTFLHSNGIATADLRYESMHLLLQAGVRGESVAVGLIDAIDGSHHTMRFVKMLLEQGNANINYNNGESILRAIKYQDVELLNVLMKKHASGNTLNQALNLVMSEESIDQNTRHEIGDIILARKVSGDAINDALVSCVHIYPTDHKLIGMILAAGASIDHSDGQAMQIALSQSDIPLLDLILKRSTRSPQPTTLVQLLVQVLNVKTVARKLRISNMLLGTQTSLSRTALGPLVANTFDSSQDLRVLELFLMKGASVDYGNARAIQKAVNLGHFQALKMMLSTSLSENTVRLSFDYAWRAEPTVRLSLLGIIMENPKHLSFINLNQYLILAVQETPCSDSLVRVLLEKGATTGYKDSESIRVAVSRADKYTLETLLEYCRVTDVQRGFETAVDADDTWSHPDAMSTMTLLLNKGASGEVVDRCLLRAVERYASYPNATAITGLLVTHAASSASSDYLNGYTLQVAAKSGNRELIEKVLCSRPSASTVNNAFPYILQSAPDEGTVLEMITMFVTYAKDSLRASLDLNSGHKELRPVLFECIERWPKSPSILKALLQVGSAPDQVVSDSVDGTSPTETMTAFLWAISRMGHALDISLLTLMLEAGANPSFTTQTSRLTPLLVAAKSSHFAIVELLISHKVDLSTADHSLCTALRYATMHGDLQMMELLINGQALPNDGSLHEAVAARNCKAVSLLLSAGHGPNVPSSLHSMQPPLAHLIRQEVVPDQLPAVEAMFKLLYEAGANANYICDKKSLLIIALDTPKAGILTLALLSAFMGANVNEDFNLFRHKGYVYSPTSYLNHFKTQMNALTRSDLLRALSSYSANDVYYSEDGPQPLNYTPRTAPRHVVQKETARRDLIEHRRLQEEERQRQIAFEDVERARVLRLEQENAERERQRTQAAHALQLQHERERNAARLYQIQEENRLQLEQTQREERLRLEAARTSNQLQIEAARTSSQLQVEAARTSSRLEMEAARARGAEERATLNRQESINAANFARGAQLQKAQLEWSRAESRRLEAQSQLAIANQGYIDWDSTSMGNRMITMGSGASNISISSNRGGRMITNRITEL